MGVLDINREIKARFNETWGNTTPVAWPNKTFVPEVGEPWVRIFIRTFPRQLLELGTTPKTYRTSGLIQIQVFTPKGEGDKEALQYADQIASIFNIWCGATVRCRESSIKTIGESDDGWYQVNISVPFHQDEVI